MMTVVLVAALIITAWTIRGVNYFPGFLKSRNSFVLLHWGTYYCLFFLVVSGPITVTLPVKMYIAGQCASAVSGLTGLYQRKTKSREDAAKSVQGQGS